MSDVALRLTYSVEVDASRAFAWQYRTNVANWNDPPATFTLDGPFAAGSSGRTLFPGQEPIQWRIRDVRPEKSFAMEMQLDQAMLVFEWSFDELPGSRTRLTQEIVLSGVNAEAYAAQVEAGFGPTLPDGMKRIAADLAAAAAGSR